MSCEKQDPRIQWLKTTLIPDLFKTNKLPVADPQHCEIIVIDAELLTEAYSLTRCYRTTVKIRHSVTDEVQTISLVAKFADDMPANVFESVGFDLLFLNEETAYKEIICHFNAASAYPKFYYSHRKPLDCVIVLSDFATDGWRMSKAKYNLSLEHAMEAVKTLGCFHGECFALKETEPEKMANIRQLLKESRYTSGMANTNWYGLNIKCVEGLYRVFQESNFKKLVPNEFLMNLTGFLKDPMEATGKLVKSFQEPFATICHGDYLRNNIAFKYADEELEHPTGALMFDFQTLRYGSPMIDLVTFMSLSTGDAIRTKHFDEIMKMYQQSLVTSYLVQTGKSSTEIPSHLELSNIMREYTMMLPVGINIASFFLIELDNPRPPAAAIADLGDDQSIDYLFDELYSRLRPVIKYELSALIHHTYEMCERYNVDYVQLMEHYSLNNGDS